MRLATLHVATPIGGRTAQFTVNWCKLIQDQWVLSTIRGYQIPLDQWPNQLLSTNRLGESQQDILLTEVEGLVGKEAAQWVSLTQVHVASPMFIVLKSRGGWRPIIDLRYLNSHLEPPHFKMEGLYMLPEVLRKEWHMAKIDLKDAYLTIPIAQEHQCLLSSQIGVGKWVPYQCLPFGLCTAPFVFSKVTKPLIGLLRQLGIQLIIYLDNLLIASPSTLQILQDLSTVYG